MLLFFSACKDSSDKDKDEPVENLDPAVLTEFRWQSETETDYFITDQYADRDTYWNVYYFLSDGTGLVKSVQRTYDAIKDSYSTMNTPYGFEYHVEGGVVTVLLNSGEKHRFSYKSRKLQCLDCEELLTPGDMEASDRQFIKENKYIVDGTDPNNFTYDYALNLQGVSKDPLNKRNYIYQFMLGFGGEEFKTHHIQSFGMVVRCDDGKVTNSKYYDGDVTRWPLYSGAYFEAICPGDDREKNWCTYSVAITSSKSSIEVNYYPRWFSELDSEYHDGASLTKRFKAPDSLVNEGTSDDDKKDDEKPDNGVGSTNGHEWVDLGLSVKWAVTNVGASTAYEAGSVFQWGITEPHTSNLTSQYSHPHFDKTTGTYKDIGDCISGTMYDAATVNWRSGWRMPTTDEWRELDEKCKSKKVTKNGVKGREFTGPNGNTLFICYVSAYVMGTGGKVNDGAGLYWSGSKGNDSRPHFIDAFRLQDSYPPLSKERYQLRSEALAIRPVIE